MPYGMGINGRIDGFAVWLKAYTSLRAWVCVERRLYRKMALKRVFEEKPPTLWTSTIVSYFDAVWEINALNACGVQYEIVQLRVNMFKELQEKI